MRVRGKNPKTVLWNDEVTKSKEAAWKVKICIYRNIKDMNEQFGRKMNEYLNGNQLFWKEVNKVNREKVESCNKIKCEGFGRIILRTFIIWISRSRLQYTCVALMVFKEES